MGAGRDPGAVVDEHCRVHGTRGLWVVDASVMPAAPRVVPNLTVMMIAERVADDLLMDAAEEMA
jgi:choline dehydrogenase-like flavoprotein